mmetsp:Transcript_11641/g.17488  ORF Transcript_11641/g.17488 Transcript_11641/m.17488 type:complete len:306 (-) Transcript_11641:378-1295(-)
MFWLLLCGILLNKSAVEALLIPFAISGVTETLTATFDAVRQASLPTDLESAVAAGLSEAFAGAIGAFASRSTSNALGSQKRDPLIVKISSTSAFFGVRGFVKGLGRLLGIPRPLSIALASVVGSFVSERTKLIGRANFLDNEGLKQNSTYDNTTNEKIIDIAEYSGDISKWIVYDSLVGMSSVQPTFNDNGIIQEVSCSFYGSVAATVGISINKLLNDAEKKGFKWPPSSISSLQSKPIGVEELKVSRAVGASQFRYVLLEGAVLFGCYNFIQHLLESAIPSEFNFKFEFNQIIEEVEKEIKKLQ